MNGSQVRDDPRVVGAVRKARLLLVATMGACLVLSLVRLEDRSPLVPVALCFVLLAALGWLHAVRHPRRACGPVVALCTLVVALVIPEFALRAVRYRYETGIEFGYPQPNQFTRFILDETLFWKASPDAGPVNSLGFFGPEPLVPKPAHTTRLLFLGDSCTVQGYPELATATLNARASSAERTFECVDLALNGYTSHQGRILADLHADRLRPDVTFIYFGWNDHWRAVATTDAEKQIRVDHSAFGRVFEQVYSSSRLMQACKALAMRISGAKRIEFSAETRVPAAAYRANLEALHARLTAAGSKVVFVTAPTSHERVGFPIELAELGAVTDPASGLALHRAYNDIVRAVARERSAVLLDMARDFDALPDLRPFFLADGIHFTEAGRMFVAQRVAETVQSLPASGQ